MAQVAASPGSAPAAAAPSRRKARRRCAPLTVDGPRFRTGARGRVRGAAPSPDLSVGPSSGRSVSARSQRFEGEPSYRLPLDAPSGAGSVGSERRLLPLGWHPCVSNPRWSPRTFRKRSPGIGAFSALTGRNARRRGSDRVATLLLDGSSIAQPRGARTAGAATCISTGECGECTDSRTPLAERPRLQRGLLTHGCQPSGRSRRSDPTDPRPRGGIEGESMTRAPPRTSVSGRTPTSRSTALHSNPDSALPLAPCLGHLSRRPRPVDREWSTPPTGLVARAAAAGALPGDPATCAIRDPPSRPMSLRRPAAAEGGPDGLLSRTAKTRGTSSSRSEQQCCIQMPPKTVGTHQKFPLGRTVAGRTNENVPVRVLLS